MCFLAKYLNEDGGKESKATKRLEQDDGVGLRGDLLAGRITSSSMGDM